VKIPKLDLTRTRLENGLTLLTLEKHDVPIVTSTIWYHVGSVNEGAGQTGISHFLEHLMFKGTKTYAKGEIDFLTASYGGYNNAGTIFDYTMYYFNFSSDRWELALQIEADRMRHCIFDPKEFEAERKVVLEEFKRQQDSPWGELGMTLEATMFQVHPYHHPVIGWQADLEKITIEQVVAYYQTYYVPNNATLVIVGDIDTAATIKKVEHYFGHLPPNPNLPRVTSQEPPQQQEQRFTLSQDTNLKRLQIGYHTVTLAEADNYVLEIIDYLLSHGKTSRLYQRLIEQDQLVNFIDAFNHPRKFAGVFYLFASLRPGMAPELVERAIGEELTRLQTERVTEEELQKIQTIVAADFIFEIETTGGLAHALGEYEVLDAGDYINTYVEQLQQITPADIQRVAQTYFVDQNRTIGWSLPQDPAEEQDVEPDELETPPTTDMVFYTPLSFSVSKYDHARPVSVPAVFSSQYEQLRHHRWTLDNGLTLLFLENRRLPILAVEAFVDAGQLYEPEDKAGVAVLTGQLLDEGTSRRSAFEIAHAIESVGGSLDTQSRGASLQVLSKDTALALDLLADILLRPIFDPDQLEKARQRLLGSLEGDEDNPSLLAYNAFREMLYGTHPYHRPTKGYHATVQALTRADVLAYHAACFCPNNTILAIVGDADPLEIFEYVQRYFGAWERQALPQLDGVQIPQPVGCQRKHLERAKEQVHLYLGHPGVTRMNPDFYTLFTLDHILGVGAGFTDRISRTLRDEEGLAYVVTANITQTSEKEQGMFAAYIGTSPENIQRSIDGLLREIRTIQNEPVTPEELELAKNYITGSYVFNFETSTQLAHYLINVERYQLGNDFIWNFPEIIQRVTVADIQRVARQYLDPENYYLVTAGSLAEHA